MLGQGKILHITIDVYLNFGGKIRWWKGFRSIDQIRYLECGVMFIEYMFWQAIISLCCNLPNDYYEIMNEVT